MAKAESVSSTAVQTAWLSRAKAQESVSAMRFRIAVLLIVGMVIAASVYAQDDAPLFPPTNDYYVDANVDNNAPYVGQRITYTLRFYDSISSPAVVALPDFAGVWR